MWPILLASSDAEEVDQGGSSSSRSVIRVLKTGALERLETERERRASVGVAYDFYQRDQAFAGSLIAGGLSVKVFLWFLPFSLSFVVVIGTLADWLDRPPSELAEDSGLIPALARMVEAAVDASDKALLYLALLGIVLLLWAGLGVVRALRPDQPAGLEGGRLEARPQGGGLAVGYRVRPGHACDPAAD